MVRASERLHVTQSTVTARLKALEAEFGQRLLNRHKSGITPTASGVRLRRNAETIVALWRQACQETDLLPPSVESVCNLGCHPDLWEGMAKTFFTYLTSTWPDVAISVHHGSNAELGGWLDTGLIDVAFTFAPSTGSHQRVFEIGRDELILVSTEEHAPVTFNPGYVYVEGGEAFGREHAIAYADAWTAQLTFGHAALALEHLDRAGGSAYVPQRIANAGLASGRLHVLDALTFERATFAVVNEPALADWPWFDDALHHLLDESEP